MEVLENDNVGGNKNRIKMGLYIILLMIEVPTQYPDDIIIIKSAREIRLTQVAVVRVIKNRMF